MGNRLLSSILETKPQTTSMRVLLLSLLAAVAATNEYCSIKCTIKGITYPHTMCTYNKDGLGEKCTKTKELGLRHTVNDAEKKIIVDKHNELRRRIARGQETIGNMPKAANMMELEWDDELAKIAQRWANQCTWGHDKCRVTSDGCYSKLGVGQNMAASGSTAISGASPNWEASIQSWYDEVKDYSASEIGNFTDVETDDGKEIGHFTQLVWAETHKVGCGFVGFYSNEVFNRPESFYINIHVCNYAKSGNMQGGYSVYKTGEPCSQCPRNAMCHKDLCKLN